MSTEPTFPTLIIFKKKKTKFIRGETFEVIKNKVVSSFLYKALIT